MKGPVSRSLSMFSQQEYCIKGNYVAVQISSLILIDWLNAKLLLALASTVILGCESHETHYHIVTDLTVLQIWTLLLNGRVRIWVLLTQRFSEYTGQRKTNPLLRNVYKQNAYFRGNEYIDKPLLMKRNRGRIVEFTQQRDTLTTAASKVKRTLGQGVLYTGRKIYVRGVDLDSQSASRRRRRTGRLKSERVKYGRKSQGTRTREWLR
jgi:hypothetical protein